MADLYLPVGIPIGFIPSATEEDPSALSGVVATLTAEAHMSEVDFLIWSMAFTDPTMDGMYQQTLAFLSQVEDAHQPTPQEFGARVHELVKAGWLLRIPNDPMQALPALRQVGWHRTGFGNGLIFGGEFSVTPALVPDSDGGLEADPLDPMAYHVWRMAGFFRSFDDFIKAGGLSDAEVAPGIFTLATTKLGILGFLVPAE